MTRIVYETDFVYNYIIRTHVKSKVETTLYNIFLKLYTIITKHQFLFRAGAVGAVLEL